MIIFIISQIICDNLELSINYHNFYRLNKKEKYLAGKYYFKSQKERIRRYRRYVYHNQLGYS